MIEDRRGVPTQPETSGTLIPAKNRCFFSPRVNKVSEGRKKRRRLEVWRQTYNLVYRGGPTQTLAEKDWVAKSPKRLFISRKTLFVPPSANLRCFMCLLNATF